MLPLNPLYEVVPVELMPEDDTNEYYVKYRYGLQQFDKRYAPIIRELGTKVYDVYLRPLPPERMEEWVREIWEAANEERTWLDNQAYMRNPKPPDLQQFTDNLINEMSK